MPLQPFSFPVPETRFLKAGSLIYKFKIKGGTSYSEDKDFKGECFNQELEDVIRTVLGNLDHLEPFSTARHIVFPYKSPWGKVHKHTTKERKLYPFIITLYMEKNMHKRKRPEEEEMRHISSVSESRSKRCCRDSPLEEAILKEFSRMEGENSKEDLDHQRSEEEEEEEEQEEVTEDPMLAYEPETTPESRSKRCCRDSPLEEAILKEFSRMEGENSKEDLDHQRSEEEEEEEEQEEVTEDPMLAYEPETTPEEERTPERPGILKRLARNLFPFVFKP
ncbi:uncharacterized protein C11orf85 homolog [Austrofundulus limnaeus]|uniref:Uncharacterized protein C11orf85 homolog n=1 Tax=Austrofundulus limnaeus TaxID=52670 RepID=A0A2I4C3C0_AUSLI|nr:PREDICTED: uncharacterized protein C11orf85 homolog [Austrofundulus limnaeus]XP_013874488.1 PREDICTED: uncharacterized protein C11orf85 homolog [Austrofundulus limnaeus]XP_013874489.1 PREDICTED: uncharacterized protein C11orf85 homolog [Austrofundulus limnaeus]XP_013874490.1 PREDICTED: uncharacterized protein C11orf85 homolog [Austrofundulus limnaeus]XP_013874491.1 PREDICTED: uncharacterized protein C11orf85 homolog [Austrofundulus limnaeus]